MDEKVEIFLCYLAFHVSLFLLSLVFLMAYFVSVKWTLASPAFLITMYLSYKKGKGEKIEFKL